VEEAAAPLAASLRAHFSAGRPTDRPDRPEWLFGTALALARSLAPSLAPLQGAIAAHGLGRHYSAPLEFARAMRSAVQARAAPVPAALRAGCKAPTPLHSPHLLNLSVRAGRPSDAAMRCDQHLCFAATAGFAPLAHVVLRRARLLQTPTTRLCAAQGILREHVLPRLEALGAPALWLHLAEQAAAFERALAPLRGLPAAAAAPGDADADAPELWAPGSCLETVCANPVRRPPQSPHVGRPRGAWRPSAAWLVLKRLRQCQSWSRALRSACPGARQSGSAGSLSSRSGAPSAASLHRGAAAGRRRRGAGLGLTQVSYRYNFRYI
jgi:hypothetical protein